MNNINNTTKEERKEPVEVAARKVDLDEDYDNTSEDGKHAPAPTSAPTAATPARSSPNGSMGLAPKQEATA